MPANIKRIDCSVEDCNRPVKERGWCSLHYQRWRTNGDPLITLTPNRALPIEQRFWQKVQKTDTCWLWRGTLWEGYGRFQIGKKSPQAHRIAYEMLKGPIPEGLQLDHLCRVRNCVNPDHLEPVTLQENIARGETGITKRQRTHCPAGHPYDEANTYTSRQGKRHCKECGRIHLKERRARSRPA